MWSPCAGNQVAAATSVPCIFPGWVLDMTLVVTAPETGQAHASNSSGRHLASMPLPPGPRRCPPACLLAPPRRRHICDAL